MFPRGLKTSVVIDLATLLAIAMLLVNFVMIGVAHRDLLKAEKNRARLFLSAVDLILANTSPADGLSADTTKSFYTLLETSDFSCLAIINSKKKIFFQGGQGCRKDTGIASLLSNSALSGTEKVKFNGTTWGVFWQQRKELTMASPLKLSNGPGGAAAIVLPLAGIYQYLRESQNVFYAYFFANLIILTSLGFYRIHKVLLKPLIGIVARTEDFSDDDGFYFASDKPGGEFARLSKGLNVMLKRIKRDKMKLQSSVSSLEKVNLDLKKAQNEMIRAEKLASVGRLSAGIAHEIGNPIGITLGYFDLIKQGGLTTEEQQDFIARAEGEVNRINVIIRQLLDFSRPAKDSGIHKLSAHAIIQDVENIIGVQPLMAGIELELQLGAENDNICGDPNLLRQVLVNLFINAADAIKATDKKATGKIIIRTELRPGSDLEDGLDNALMISVIDDGEGISAANLANIFDPFYTTKDPGKGTGLGLSICFTIIDSIGGRIIATSEKGEGANISILLPVPIDNGIST